MSSDIEWQSLQKNGRVSKRNANREWKGKSNKLFDLLKPTSNPEKFYEDKKKFHFDQKTVTRKMALSDQVNEDNEDPSLGQMIEKVKVQMMVMK